MIPGYAKVDPADGSDRFHENRSVQSARFTFDDGSHELLYFLDEPTLQTATVDVHSQTVTVESLTTSEPGSRDYTGISKLLVAIE